MPRTAYSCIVDNDSVMMAQSFVFVTTLTTLHGAAAKDIHVHIVDIDDAGYLGWLAGSGVTIVRRPVFDARNRYCNKLQQLESFRDTAYDCVALMDCDTAWVGGDVPAPRGGVAAKIVDLANPTEALLAGIFAAADLDAPDWVPVTFPNGKDTARTDRNNCNGGFYLFDRAFLAELAPVWQRWATWCIDRAALFGTFHAHADQVGFALAMRELAKQVEPLDIAWNYPAHMEKRLLPNIAPQIVHYHKTLTGQCEIPLIGLAQPDAAIGRINAALREQFTTRLPSSLFWNLRYATDPTLGSGIGSRGEILEQKRALLGYALRGYEKRAVLDVGCGDLEVARTLPLQHYIGLDVSREALALARQKRPDWNYLLGHPADVVGATPPAIVICLDVLIHQTSRADFDRLLDALVKLTGERLILSGYNEAPRTASAIVNFHEPLLAALRRRGVFREIAIIGAYRELVLVVADKPERGARFHANDIDLADFNHAATLTPRPDLLRHLADASRQSFGFFTKHFPRALEYPWIAAKLEGDLAHQEIIDIGAGLCPIPLYLAERGATVHCLDSHPQTRTRETQAQWNEWGFFDYAALHPRLRSHHVDASAFVPTRPADVVYSISVIEHMPRRIWEASLAAAAGWLKPDGRLLLTLDLVPGTDFLWNFAEGVEVEPPGLHGDVRSMVARIEALGFTIEEQRALRQIPKSRTDVLLLDCRKTGAAAATAPLARPAAVLALLKGAGVPAGV